MLEEKDFSASKLSYMIDELLINQEKYNMIKDNLSKIQTISSSEVIYDKIKEII